MYSFLLHLRLTLGFARVRHSIIIYLPNHEAKMAKKSDDIRDFTDIDLFDYAERLGFGSVYLKVDKKTGLRAIIAIHSTKRGPAIGGTRFIDYPSTDAAIKDALRLARGMTQKAAICNLKHGGAKSVIMHTNKIGDRKALFQEFGKFVEEVGGDYIAAIDSGTNVADMDEIQKTTQYITCTSDSPGNGDPSPHTATGVLRGIEAAVKFKFGKDDFRGLHMSIQGVGNVGSKLAGYLHEKGARLTVCDVHPENAQFCAEKFGAKVVDPEAIYDVECDLFAPCALGAVINDYTLSRLKTKMIVGAANNQLAVMRFDQELYDRDILYLPDFLVNAGGLIHVAGIYESGNAKKAHDSILAIYDESLNLLERSKKENKPTNQIALEIVEERLA